ncbi:MAG TPA: hypothetical protein EYH06_11775 [Chromatiales bacterium]|nr:hypothetical protein [Thiotrichales bacterium]HIP69241.1 hypothetical protein [Chromatiales bacterium]
MNSLDDEDIPVLSDLIFPGNPQKIDEKTNPEPSVKEQLEQLPRDNIQTIKPAPKKSNLEEKIAEHIDFIMHKHIAMAREEITRVIMAELRTRLPRGKKNHD